MGSGLAPAGTPVAGGLPEVASMKNGERLSALDALVRSVPAAGSRFPQGTSAEAVFERELLQHRRLFAEIASLRAAVCQAGALMTDAIQRGGRLLFFGNGAAAYLAAELSERLTRGRWPPIAMALALDSTDGGGDPQGFARLIAANARWADCAIAISASGRSMNVVRGLQKAHAMGVTTVGLLGCGGGAARLLAEAPVVIAHDDRARIQEAHVFIGHIWCDQIESALGWR